mmetsp:Transcript_54017/g.92977  ORF Transcript_54017/g.92977 Transcript_54017/m.92977 type:complete len:227 (-) Transcript_54017:245-925(-)
MVATHVGVVQAWVVVVVLFTVAVVIVATGHSTQHAALAARRCRVRGAQFAFPARRCRDRGHQAAFSTRSGSPSHAATREQTIFKHAMKRLAAGLGGSGWVARHPKVVNVAIRHRLGRARKSHLFGRRCGGVHFQRAATCLERLGLEHVPCKRGKDLEARWGCGTVYAGLHRRRFGHERWGVLRKRRRFVEHLNGSVRNKHGAFHRRFAQWSWTLDCVGDVGLAPWK